MSIRITVNHLYKDKYGKILGPFVRDGEFWRARKTIQLYCDNGKVHPDWEAPQYDLVEDLGSISSSRKTCPSCGRTL